MCNLLKKWILPIFLLLFVIGIWYHIGGYDKALGDEADKFDALNSLFAGLAFSGMLCTLFMQRQELSLQRDELKSTREELELTRVATQGQADIQMKSLLLNTTNTQITELFRRIEDLRRASEEHHRIRRYNDVKWREESIEYINNIKEARNEQAILFMRLKAIEAILLPYYQGYSLLNTADTAKEHEATAPLAKQPANSLQQDDVLYRHKKGF